MSKIKRIHNRINRIEDRFRKKVAKGKKGTDMDIELHERRIRKLIDKIPAVEKYISPLAIFTSPSDCILILSLEPLPPLPSGVV